MKVLLVAVLATTVIATTHGAAPDLSILLANAGRFVDEFTQSLNGVQLEEQCSAEVEQQRRSEKADLIFVSPGPGAILAIRDVFEVDGTPIRPRSDRAMALLKEGKPGALQVAQFLPPVPKFSCWLDTRRLSMPTAPLRFLVRGLQSRSKFTLDGVETSGGASVATVRFTEQQTPSLVAAYNDLSPVEALTFGLYNPPRKDSTSASGRFWIEVGSGRLRQAELRVRTGIHNGPLESTDGETSVVSTTRYGTSPGSTLWLPQLMDISNEATVRPIVAVSDASSANYVSRRERFQIRYVSGSRVPLDPKPLFDESVLAARSEPSQVRPGAIGQFGMMRRLNAHGDEYMGLALTSDGKSLVVGTEKGDVVVWDIAARRITHRWHQGSAIHAVAALGDPAKIVAVGGPHDAAGQRGVARVWNIETGTFEELRNAGAQSLTALDVDPSSGLIAASSPTGGIFAWPTPTSDPAIYVRTNEFVAGLALVKRTVLFCTLDVEKMMSPTSRQPPWNRLQSWSIDRPRDSPRTLATPKTGRMWMQLTRSPDARWIAATYTGADGKPGVAWLDATNGKELEVFGRETASWTAAGDLVLFDSEAPVERGTRDASGRVRHDELIKGGAWHQAGAPSGLTGHVVAPDGNKIWEVFRLGAAIVECDLAAKTFTELDRAPGSVYTMQVAEDIGGGLMATGGDDGWVRVWRMTDFSLMREFKVDRGVPQGVGLERDGRHVIWSYGFKQATGVARGDLETGEVQQLPEIAQSFVPVFVAAGGYIYGAAQKLALIDPSTAQTTREFRVDATIVSYAVSANGTWLAVVDSAGVLSCFNVASGDRVARSETKIDQPLSLSVSDQGPVVLITEWSGALRRWDVVPNTSRVVAAARQMSHSLFVTPDGSRVAVGGNHRDVAVFDVARGTSLLYHQTDAADFYITNVWVSGQRLIFTTDAGVLYIGMFRP